MIEEIFTGRTYQIFLVFAAVGIIEMGIFLFRIYSYSNYQETLEQVRTHLEEAHDSGEIPDQFYERHLDILEN